MRCIFHLSEMRIGAFSQRIRSTSSRFIFFMHALVAFIISIIPFYVYNCKDFWLEKSPRDGRIFLAWSNQLRHGTYDNVSFARWDERGLFVSENIMHHKIWKRMHPLIKISCEEDYKVGTYNLWVFVIEGWGPLSREWKKQFEVYLSSKFQRTDFWGIFEDENDLLFSSFCFEQFRDSKSTTTNLHVVLFVPIFVQQWMGTICEPLLPHYKLISFGIRSTLLQAEKWPKSFRRRAWASESLSPSKSADSSEAISPLRHLANDGELIRGDFQEKWDPSRIAQSVAHVPHIGKSG